MFTCLIPIDLWGWRTSWQGACGDAEILMETERERETERETSKAYFQ
jgi:hypothetical protein